jgi:hypothetical protein
MSKPPHNKRGASSGRPSSTRRPAASPQGPLRRFFCKVAEPIRLWFKDRSSAMSPADETRHSAWRLALGPSVMCIVLAFAMSYLFNAKFLRDFEKARIWFAIAACWPPIWYGWWLFTCKNCRNFVPWGICAIVLGCLVLVLAYPEINQRTDSFAQDQQERYLAKNPAELMPDKPSPKYGCPNGLNAVVGGNVFTSISFPFHAVEVHHVPLITLDVSPNGAVATFDVRDKNGLMVARVKRNIIEPFPHGHLDQGRTPHRLSISDESGGTALDIEYTNAKTITINGKFYIGPNIYLLLKDDGFYEIDAREPEKPLMSFSHGGGGNCLPGMRAASGIAIG